MPESYGKRKRSQVKAKKANAKEERRLARNQRRADRAAGGPVGPPLGDPIDLDEQGLGDAPPAEPEAESQDDTEREEDG